MSNKVSNSSNFNDEIGVDDVCSESLLQDTFCLDTDDLLQ